MNYGKHRGVNYALEDLQKARDIAADEEKESCQKNIDNYFFGGNQKRKSKKERKRERRKKRQQFREEEYDD